MTIDTLVGSSFLTRLLNGSLTRANWVADGDYLPSYSQDIYNTYRAPELNSYKYSGYFLTVSRQQQYHQCLSR